MQKALQQRRQGFLTNEALNRLGRLRAPAVFHHKWPQRSQGSSCKCAEWKRHGSRTAGASGAISSDNNLEATELRCEEEYGESSHHIGLPSEDCVLEMNAEKIEWMRRIRRYGILAASSVLGVGLLFLMLLDDCRPLVKVAAGLAGSAVLCTAFIPRIIGELDIQIGSIASLEIVGGRWYVQWGAMPGAGPISQDDVVIRETGDSKGRGAFATTKIPKDTLLTAYEGEILDTKGYFARYPDGVSDYCMALDDDTLIDAREVSVGNRFTGGHVNHSRKRYNVKRWYQRRRKAIYYFASRDIEPGEELLLDYGRQYWKGREAIELE